MNCEALSKDKWVIKEGDLLEIFPPQADQTTTWRYYTYVLGHRCTVQFGTRARN